MHFDLAHILLAILGLSFIVFIHELGHYLVALHVGMKVEVFSIGFGKPIYTWTHKGVKWQVCYLLFGGYVKIAGMDKEGKLEPYQIKDGFYGKGPWDRIKVVLMGPIVNIVFAFLVFSALWMMGGREKRFEEFTNVIGWVDPKSELIQDGVRPGDIITEYGGKPFTGFKDLLSGGVKGGDLIAIAGDKVNYVTGQHTPYKYDVKAYQMEGFPEGMKTIGIAPANTVLFYGFESKEAPAYNSGIEVGDRVIWANGETIFSSLELRNVVNRNEAYLTVERKGDILHLRVPRVALDDFQLNSHQRDEFMDWKHALGVSTHSQDLFFIPFEVDVLGTVKGKLSYIDSDLVDETKRQDESLQRGDHIIAVNGKAVTNGLEIFNELRMQKVLLVVQRQGAPKVISADQANAAFTDVNWKGLQTLTGQIGVSEKRLNSIGNLVLLEPIVPAPLEKNGPRYLFINARIGDQKVVYNPTPITQFKDVLSETWFTLKSLVSGDMNPKWLSGPVGIVKAMQYSIGVGFKEALYWMGLISLSLGIMNLLPIPGLDGGHFCFSLWEMITRRPISSKAMGRMLLPFFVLIVAFFVYVTFHDISRFF